MITVAFDCDGTLVDFFDQTKPRHEIVALFHCFQKRKCKMFIWSFQGLEHARQVRDLLGLSAIVVEKCSFIPDIAVDDEERGIARVVIPA
jgi:hydroxymethylpyrimidine pyrophosphatase-like HAD family hydrolase